MPDAWLPDRRRLRPVPLRAVLEAMQRDEHVLTVVVGQPLTAVARALYAGGAILVECDADQNPVAAYRRALTWAPSGDNLVAWGCWICGEEFTLRGSRPRFRVAAVTWGAAPHEYLEPPAGTWSAAICPECSVYFAPWWTAMEEAARE